MQELATGKRCSNARVASIFIWRAASLPTGHLSTKILYVYFKRRGGIRTIAGGDDRRSSGDGSLGRSRRTSSMGPHWRELSVPSSPLPFLSSRGPKYSTWPRWVSSRLRIATLAATSVVTVVVLIAKIRSYVTTINP
jgi:hypothetical protein